MDRVSNRVRVRYRLNTVELDTVGLDTVGLGLGLHRVVLCSVV